MANRFGRRNKKEDIKPENTSHTAEYLLESDQSATINGHQAYNFLQGIRSVDGNYINNDLLMDKMCQDSVISAALDIWTEDALQKDPFTGEMFIVDVDTVEDDPVAKKLSDGLSKRLNHLLKKDLRAEKYLATWCKRVLKYGNCYLKLDFADKLTDEKLKLKESVSDKERFEKIAIKTIAMMTNNEDSKLDYAFDNPQKMLPKGKLNEAYKVDYESMMRNNISVPKEEKFTTEVLKEDVLTSKQEEKTVRGRWYTEILGHGTNIYELSSKQKVVAYIDRDAPNKFIKPDNIINFANNTGKHRVSFEVGDVSDKVNQKEYYSLERGEGFLENAMVAWQVLSALEDILLLTRMTRSILYRIFSIEVGNKGNKETAQILDRLKNRLKMEETIDIRSRIYNSTLTQVPLADSVFIPTHNGVGVTDVKTVGGDVNLRDAIDLDYFRDKLHSALRIPAPYLSYTESLPGGIGDSSLTRMDIRYSRTVARIKAILAEGLKDICIRYLQLTIGDRAFEELPDFRIKFASTNSAEDISRANLQQTFMETLQKSLNTLKELGIDIATNPEGYKKTRETLINEYFGNTLAEAIKADERLTSVTAPTELANDKTGGNSGPSDMGPDTEINIDSGPSGMGPEAPEEGEIPEEDLDNVEVGPETGPAPDTETTNELS